MESHYTVRQYILSSTGMLMENMQNFITALFTKAENIIMSWVRYNDRSVGYYPIKKYNNCRITNYSRCHKEHT